MLAALCLAGLAFGASAETTFTLEYSGTKISGLNKIIFNDDANATFNFDNSEIVAAPMQAARVIIDYSDNSAIKDIVADPKAKKGVYNLKGQYLGESDANLQPGFYIIDGQKVYIK